MPYLLSTPLLALPTPLLALLTPTVGARAATARAPRTAPGSTSTATRARTGTRASAGSLDPLYRRIAKDLRAGRPLVVTVHVPLCDNRQIACGSAKLGRGDAPDTNLYWGGAAGLRAWFDHRRGWKRVHRDRGTDRSADRGADRGANRRAKQRAKRTVDHSAIRRANRSGARRGAVVERVVYRHRIRRPGPRWRRLGVTQAFSVYLVGLAYRGRAIGRAVRRFIRDVSGDRGSTLRLADGTRLRIGGRSHVVGYAGHNRLMDEPGFRWPAFTRKRPVGWFVLACRSAQHFAAQLTRPPTRALLLTRVLMYPGAFTIEGLLRALARARSHRQVFRQGARYYARFQKRPARLIRRLFTHGARPAYRRRYLRRPRRHGLRRPRRHGLRRPRRHRLRRPRRRRLRRPRRRRLRRPRRHPRPRARTRPPSRPRSRPRWYPSWRPRQRQRLGPR